MKHTKIFTRVSAAALCSVGLVVADAGAGPFQDSVVAVTNQSLTQMSIQSIQWLPTVPNVGGCITACAAPSGGLRIGSNAFNNHSHVVNNINTGSNVVQGGQIGVSIATSTGVARGSGGPQ